ncbi:MAG: DUF4136 domain-containing protein [Cytophaga sp.]|uniref:DUF4136 domain-containing protein n=1 Tax=Cytophaga sp. TaxID=29535 RepID=UPI003F7DEC78
MKKSIFIPLVLLCLLSAFVMKMKFFSDYDKKTDFSKYKTFAWIAPYDTVISMHRKDKPYGNFIIKTCDAELLKKGMVLDTVNPDVVFMFDTKIKESDVYKQAPTTSVGVSVYAPAYYGQNYYGGPAFDPNGYNMGSATPVNGVPANGYPANATGYWGGYYYGASVSTPIAGGQITKHHVEEGSLIINMYETKSRRFIWGGGANQDINITTDIPTEINAAVAGIFKQLPINHKK